MTYNFNITLRSSKGHKVDIDEAQLYGCWEYKDGSEGGGLWFCAEVIGAPDGAETPSGKLMLQDYDGVSELPASIVVALREAGYLVDEDDVEDSSACPLCGADGGTTCGAVGCKY